MTGVITACAGGIILDVLASVPSILSCPEIYVTAAALAAALFVVLVLVAAGVTRSSRIRLIAPRWTLWVGFHRPSTTHGFARSAER